MVPSTSPSTCDYQGKHKGTEVIQSEMPNMWVNQITACIQPGDIFIHRRDTLIEHGTLCSVIGHLLPFTLPICLTLDEEYWKEETNLETMF